MEYSEKDDESTLSPLKGRQDEDGAYAPAQLSDLGLLIQATLNEKNSPEILDFQEELIARVEQQLLKQENITEELDKDIEQEMRRMMFSLEVKRVRYLLKLYYKVRLRKIEKFAASILDDENLSKRLCKHEQEFCQDYFFIVGRALKDSVLDHLPRDFQHLVKMSDMSEGNDLIPHPVLDAHVFCKLTQDVGLVTISGGGEDDQVVPMKRDDVFIIRYESVADLVRDNQAMLI